MSTVHCASYFSFSRTFSRTWSLFKTTLLGCRGLSNVVPRAGHGIAKRPVQRRQHLSVFPVASLWISLFLGVLSFWIHSRLSNFCASYSLMVLKFYTCYTYLTMKLFFVLRLVAKDIKYSNWPLAFFIRHDRWVVLPWMLQVLGEIADVWN